MMKSAKRKTPRKARIYLGVFVDPHHLEVIDQVSDNLGGIGRSAATRYLLRKGVERQLAELH